MFDYLNLVYWLLGNAVLPGGMGLIQPRLWRRMMTKNLVDQPELPWKLAGRKVLVLMLVVMAPGDAEFLDFASRESGDCGIDDRLFLGGAGEDAGSGGAFVQGCDTGGGTCLGKPPNEAQRPSGATDLCAKRQHGDAITQAR